MKEATIKDIARRADVSISTVSRVLNGNYPVSTEARQRVEQAMGELCYRPNAVARSLRSSRTNLVALLVPAISNRFFMEVAQGLEDEILKIGCNLVVASTNNSPERESELLETLLARRVDAVVLAPTGTSCPKLQELAERQVPMVLVDRSISQAQASEVLWNDFDAAYALTRHLIDNGHRRIAMVNVTLENSNGVNRLAGYRQAMQDAGLPLFPAYVSPSNFDFEDARGFVCEVLALPEPPTALFCANNVMAEGALSALKEMGLAVPRDVSLVAFGNLACNRYLTPAITNAHQDGRSMGVKAGKIIRERLEQGSDEVYKVILNAPLHLHGSVKKL